MEIIKVIGIVTICKHEGEYTLFDTASGKVIGSGTLAQCENVAKVWNSNAD